MCAAASVGGRESELIRILMSFKLDALFNFILFFSFIDGNLLSSLYRFILRLHYDTGISQW